MNMNPDLDRLQPYPFQKLATLFGEVTPNAAYQPINLSIGEPKHATPPLIIDALCANMAGLANYPTTAGSDALRQCIAQWISQRYELPILNAKTEIIPVNGSREALFSFAQAVIDRSCPNIKNGDPVVVCPNPFYQIYEGAALLAGATPYFINTTAPDHVLNYEQLPPEIWQRTQLIYVCSPGNPNGHVMTLFEWKTLFELSDRYGFIIAADECYSEIYFETPPLGALEAAHILGRTDYRNLVMFSSLSKRSNVPGMRSGFVAGDANVLQKFMLYRTYHGCAMNPAVQAASIAAWQDEAHVEENRKLYAEKFIQVPKILNNVLRVRLPEAGFYLWQSVPISDTTFAQQLYRDYNVTVLPGSYLAREVRGENPGRNFVRIALVPSLSESTDAAQRIAEFTKKTLIK